MNHPFDSVINRKDTEAIKWQKFGSDVIPMWIADMDFAIPDVVTKAISKRIQHPVLGYTSAAESLADCVANYCSTRHHWSIDTGDIYWIPGVLPAVTAACRIAGEIGEEVIVMPPVYNPLLEIPEKVGKKRIDVPMLYTPAENTHTGTWSIDFDSLEKAFSNRTAALLLSSPHNPMGVMFSESELHRIATLCASHNALLISDEIHCDLILSKTKKHVPTALAAKEHSQHVVTIMSPSKTFNLAGANCSFIHAADPQLLDSISHECLYTVPLVPTLSYCAAEAVYADGWQWHSELIEYLRGNHDYLMQAINQSDVLSMDKLDATYLAWIDTNKLTSEDASDFFINAGVGLSPGRQYGHKHYQRLNFACSRVLLEEGVERILNAVKNR